MRSKKSFGQGTTEYLIILAIVIVIALVVVGVLGGFAGQGTAISSSQSKSYWGSTHPLAITGWGIPATGATGSIVFKNLSANVITLTDGNYNNTLMSYSSTSIAPGASVTMTGYAMTCGAGAGQPYSKTFAYKYNTADITGKWFYGTSPLVGTCQ